jgi:Putative cyclase
MSDPLPSYDELPVIPGAPAGSSWGLWGADDRCGCLNLLTPERVVAAAGLVRDGTVFPMNLDMELPDPPLFNRSAFEHTVKRGSSGRSQDDELSAWNTQSSSQWDGFRHIQSAHGFYNGVDNEDHGIHHWARRGIAGRGVLADVARWREAEGRPLRFDRPDPITPDEVAATLAAQGTTVEAGDVLCLRTGWIDWYRGLDAGARTAVADRSTFACPGLAPGEATLRYLWDLHIAAVAADNPPVEVWPPGALASAEDQAAADAEWAEMPRVFAHFAILPLLGLPIGEMFDLDRLADACAADGRFEFLFTSAPLNLRAGVASPPNALAIR